MAGFGGAAAKFGGLTASVQKTTSAVQNLSAAAVVAEQRITNIGMAMKATSSFMVALRDAMEGTGWKVNEGATQSDAQKEYASKVVAQLESLESRLQSVFGSNNQAAQIIERNIQKIRDGGDPAGAMAAIRGVLGAYAAGFQQEAFSQDASIRALALELSQFINSGYLR